MLHAMPNSAIRACLVLGVFSACTAQPAEPVEPVAYNKFSVFSHSELQLMANGSASLHTQGEARLPEEFTGMTSRAALAALRDDIAAADLGSLSATYTCPALVCDAPEPARTLIVEVGGATTQIAVDGRIGNAQLPAGLGRVLQDLDTLSTQLTSTSAR